MTPKQKNGIFPFISKRSTPGVWLAKNLENLISIATLIRAYLVEKFCQINSRSYTFIRDCRVTYKISKNPFSMFIGRKNQLNFAIQAMKGQNCHNTNAHLTVGCLAATLLSVYPLDTIYRRQCYEVSRLRHREK